MKLLERAIEIASKAHAGQIDKTGKIYILHPFRVMLKMKTETEMITAVLHDVVEDSKVTFEDLKQEGFSREVITALKLVTRDSADSYERFIEKISHNKFARKIKIADLEDNINLARISKPTKKDFERVKKYKKALKVLKY